MKESDWKVFRKLRKIALDRLCERILNEAVGIASQEGMTSHERYLALYKHIKERDRDIADAFNDPRRSNAELQLKLIMRLNLLNDEEFNRFSNETRGLMERWLEF